MHLGRTEATRPSPERARALACRSCCDENHTLELLAHLRARGRTEDGSNASGQWTGWEERAPPRRAPEDRPRVARYESPQKNMNHVRETSRREVELSVRLSSLLHWDRALGTRSQKPDREECVQKRKLHTATFSAAPTLKARPRMRRKRVAHGVLGLGTNTVD